MRTTLTPIRCAALALFLLASTLHPGALARAEQRPQLRVVATVAMIGDVASEIAGDRAAVESLMGPGVDPHLYRPTRSDTARLLGADLVLYNGFLLEGKMTDTLVRIARSGRPVYAIVEGVPEDFILESAETEGHDDPHIWMDPTGWKHAARVIADAFIAVDPDGEAHYRARADAYTQRLAELDDYARAVLATIPADRRILVTSHDAFAYFGRAYDIEVVGIQGVSTVAEAGLRDIERIVETLVQRNIPAVFTESTISERNVRALVEGCRARGHALAIGGELYSDAMGSPGTYRGTYIGMIDHNVTTIARALGGDAPAGGMHGKLTHDAPKR
ncbi:MAG: manganese transporter [Phycisphaerales bacterium]|nr:MAG: manganese transporter [Phycisphaerales bacterium]